MSVSDHRTIAFGEYVLDLDSGMVFRGGGEIQLRPKQRALAEVPGGEAGLAAFARANEDKKGKIRNDQAHTFYIARSATIRSLVS